MCSVARRSDHTKEELKQLIFEAAKEIIVKEGVDGLSARKLAAKIGYTPGTIYIFYKNIGDLILHINADTLDSFYGTLESAAQPNGTPEHALKEMCSAYIKYSYENNNLWRILFEQHYPRKEAEGLPEWYTDKINKTFSLVEGVIKPVISNQSELSVQTKVLWATMHGICMLALAGNMTDHKISNAKILTDNFLKTFIKGLS